MALAAPERARPGRSRIKGTQALRVSLRRLQARADKAAAFRSDLSDRDRRWLLAVADSLDRLLTNDCKTPSDRTGFCVQGEIR